MPFRLPEEIAAAQPRLAMQMAFIAEMDKLKLVLRRTSILDGSRRENSAEHSWHLALSAMLLAEHAPTGTDPVRAVAMLLVHDCVEVACGDTFAFDTAGLATQHEREQVAATQLFGTLPPDQGAYIRGLWDEFEEASTPTAKFANALDRLHPLMQNTVNEGGTWRAHNVTPEAVLRRMDPIRTGLPALWPVVEAIVRRHTDLGYLNLTER